MEAVAFGRVQLSMTVTLLKSLGSWFATVGGGSIGREGPLIQFGGSLGRRVAGIFRIDNERARALMAAGTAAGFAAAYNTPLAAVLFVLEVVTGIVALDAILATVVATAIATTATRAVVGGGPIYGQRAFTLTSSTELIGCMEFRGSYPLPVTSGSQTATIPTSREPGRCLHSDSVLGRRPWPLCPPRTRASSCRPTRRPRGLRSRRNGRHDGSHDARADDGGCSSVRALRRLCYSCPIAPALERELPH
jgi:hypothetical protein